MNYHHRAHPFQRVGSVGTREFIEKTFFLDVSRRMGGKLKPGWRFHFILNARRFQEAIETQRRRMSVSSMPLL